MNEDEARWLMLFNIGLAVALIGIPAMIGFYAGLSIENASATPMPWRVVFAAIGFLVGGFAAWRMFARRRT
jgi:formate hydrogenlyase subunit 3/multisubunit Na+/H+ antiporter MnhD subunit